MSEQGSGELGFFVLLCRGEQIHQFIFIMLSSQTGH
jgi:hypothetical protein